MDKNGKLENNRSMLLKKSKKSDEAKNTGTRKKEADIKVGVSKKDS